MNITRINEFKAADGQSENCFEFLESLIPYIISSPGCLSCEVLRNSLDTDLFIVIEKWQKLEDHENSVKRFPKGEMEAAKDLFTGPAKGSYYHS